VDLPVHGSRFFIKVWGFSAVEILMPSTVQHKFQRGSSLVETALLIALLALVALAAVRSLGKEVRNAYCKPIGGLEAPGGQQDELLNYHWSEETQSCEPDTGGFGY
jgi:Flp pilus assembly pilin Flp